MKNICFDECNFLWKQLEAGKSIYQLPYDVESMTHVVKRLSDQKKLKAYFDFIIVEGTPGKIKWHKGKIIYKDLYEAMFIFSTSSVIYNIFLLIIFATYQIF